DGTLDYVRKADWTQETIDRAIISTAKAAERPIRPAEATSQALMRHITGDTRERREQFHASLLGSKLTDVKRAVIEQFEQNYAAGGTCVVSNRQKLAEAPLEIEDVLPNVKTG